MVGIDYGLKIIIKATRYKWKQKVPSWLLKEYNKLDKSAFVTLPFNIMMGDGTQTLDDEGLIEDCLLIQDLEGSSLFPCVFALVMCCSLIEIHSC